MEIPDYTTPYVDPADAQASSGGGKGLGDIASSIMSPPPGTMAQAGKPDWRHILGAVGAGLGLGLLGSKLSGGQITYGEALGMVGKGYADDKYKQMEQQRGMAQEQYGRQLKMVHDFFSSNALEGVDLKKYPRILELKQKYTEKLMNSEKGPGGEPLSPKEITELLGHITTAQAELGEAQKEREQSKITETAAAQQQAQVDNLTKLYMTPPPGGGPAMSPEQARAAASQAMLYEAQNKVPVDVTDPEARKLLGPRAPRGDVLKYNQERLNHERSLAIERYRAGQEQGRMDRMSKTQEQEGKRQLVRSLLEAAARTYDPDEKKMYLDRAKPLMDELGMAGANRMTPVPAHSSIPISGLTFIPRKQ